MIHTIHIHPNGFDPHAPSTLLAIPETKAKWALLAPPFWLAVHRLWWALFFYGLFMVSSFSLLSDPNTAPEILLVFLLLSGIPGIYLYLEGHQLRRNRLERQGWTLQSVVDGQDEEHAISRYLAGIAADPALPTLQQTAPHTPKASPYSGRTPKPSFGMFADQEL